MNIAFFHPTQVLRLVIVWLTILFLFACGGGDAGLADANPTPDGYTAESGLAQKGPLIQGSQITINELSTPNFQPTGRSFSLEVSSNDGKFNPSGINFVSPYLSTSALGYYFNEISGLPSSDVVFLRGLSDLSAGADTVINVNALSSISKSRIINLATGTNLLNPSTGLAYSSPPAKLPFASARAQAQAENLKAFYIYNGATLLSGKNAQPANFTALDLSQNRAADQILAAFSAAVMTAGQNGNGVNTLLSQIEADFADDGILNNSPKYPQSVSSRLCAAAAGTNFAAVAANLNNFYGTKYQPTDLSQWVDTSGCVDQVIDKYKFSASNVAVGTVSKSPAYIVGPDDVGQCFSVGGVTGGGTASLYYNGATNPVASTQLAKLGDRMELGLSVPSATGTSSAFIQRSAPLVYGTCPTVAPTTGLTRVQKYSVLTGAGAPSAVTGITPSSGEVSQIYATPANFSTQVNKSFTPTTPLTATSSVVNRGRYLIADSAVATSSSNYLTVGIPYVDTNSSGYTVILNTLTSASTYNDYLAKTIQLVSSSDGYYRLDSHLHPNEAIDVDSLTSKLKFRNNFGKIAVTGNGYITFSYDSTTHLLRAKNRYVYIFDTTSNASSYALDANFSGKEKYVNAASGVLSLTTVGSPLYLYPTPLDLGIPGFMNPQSVAMVSNAPAPLKTKITYTPTEVISRIFNNVKTTYQPQITSIGTSPTTKLAADLQLSLIKSTLEANGEKLRYEPTLYSAFRDAALATKLISDSVADGSPGQNLVPYVYFTNERDAAGKYHPFMVVVTYANPGSPNGLKDIPRPPGDGSGPYVSSKVTRYANLENYVLMIPMKDYGQVATVTDNVLGRTLWSDVPNTKKSKDVYTYADTADNGLLIDGSVMFPVFNNTLIPSSLLGELSANGCHVGQGGGGPHCHADGYQSGGALNLYNDSDYLGAIHPPLIGFGYDGIALFALYRPTDTSLKGYGTLDEFGGHNHDAIGYHYHAHTVVDYQPEGESTNLRSTLHVLMKGAYIGKIGPVPCFKTAPNFNNNKYMGGTPTSPASCAQ